MGKDYSDPGDAPTPGASVQAYAGGRLHERPRRFAWQGAWLAVEVILQQWRTPEELAFLVAVGDGRRFLLSYAWAADRWRVEPRGEKGEGGSPASNT